MAVEVQAYVKKDQFELIKISPTGDYFAATVPLEDGRRTGLAIMSRSDKKVTATFSLGKNTHVDSFAWVNDERVLISMSEKIGALDQPQLTGELYAINADGTQPEHAGRTTRGGTGCRHQDPAKEGRGGRCVPGGRPAE